MANAVSAFMAINCLCGVGMHQPFVGTPMNPNPFWNGVLLLSVYAVPSALMECLVWRILIRRVKAIEDNRLLGRTLLAHLIGVPVALAILLIPAHPYRALEGFSAYLRRTRLRQLVRAVSEYAAANKHFPSFDKPERLLDLLPERSRDDQLMLFYPSFGRFDSSGTRGVPWQWNTALSGRRVKIGDDNHDPARVWIVRRYGDPPTGMVIDFSTGSPEWTTSPAALGYQPQLGAKTGF